MLEICHICTEEIKGMSGRVYSICTEEGGGKKNQSPRLHRSLPGERGGWKVCTTYRMSLEKKTLWASQLLFRQ